jgi:beta-galactosidase GanA
MKKSLFFFCLYALTQMWASAQNIPHLRTQGTATQLIVNDQPFLILGGELGNSSSSNMEYMASIWPKVKAMHLNTILAPVYWNLLEPQEGKFDFTLVDELIKDARKYQIKLVLLWFGSWKNSMSCYAPMWVKSNYKRFPRAKDKNGRGQEIMTPFSEENLLADIKAFKALMRHIKEIDAHYQTVIMVQVENEIGMLPEARDYHPEANKAFEKPVPQEFIQYLLKNKKNLIPEFKEIWESQGAKTSGNWETVFGKSLATDEIFMAWFFGKYTNSVTEAGKQEYALPMFVNAALPREGKKPGEYPSAGPLPHLLDIWRAAGPQIDFLSPDFYNPKFTYWNDLYTRSGNPLFVPEIRFEAGIDAKAFYTFGHYNGMGFSPFSIESTDTPEKEPIGKSYEVLAQLSPIILAHQGKGTIKGALVDKTNPEQIIKMKNYVLKVTPYYTLGWVPQEEKNLGRQGACVIIQTSENDFIIAGTGVVVNFETFNPEKTIAGIANIDEGKYIDGKWVKGRNLSGDQSHQGRHLRISGESYDIQHITLYQYE